MNEHARSSSRTVAKSWRGEENTREEMSAAAVSLVPTRRRILLEDADQPGYHRRGQDPLGASRHIAGRFTRTGRNVPTGLGVPENWASDLEPLYGIEP
jgi:hypothetical protein